MSELEKNITNINGNTLEKEFQWFAMVLDIKFKSYFDPEGESSVFPVPPDLEEDESSYAQLIKKHGFGIKERIVLCLTLVPHLKSQLLDLFFTNNPQLNRPFTEFGGHAGKTHSGFLPTGETAAFLLAQEVFEERFKILELFSAHHPFATENILHLERIENKEPMLSGRLLINDKILYAITSGEFYLSSSSESFPAEKIETKMSWEDLVISPFVREEIMQIKTWINHKDELMADSVFGKHVKPGFRSLFYGPPGTGKTMTASLIGKTCGLDVYRIDLSLIVSKYIGETEKNLEKIFKHAEKKNWILFFDEADALFGKRTSTNSSNDRFANQEVAYLLQRIEDFPGIVILASNLKSNMDEAFSRRFQSTIYFPIPDPNQRLKLWENIFSGEIKLEASVDLKKIAIDYELSGGSMINIFRRSALQATQRNSKKISHQEIVDGIRKEFQKYGKTI
ncbi:MAG: ATP-binding protein [Saprospiraceae bacterium]